MLHMVGNIQLLLTKSEDANRRVHLEDPGTDGKTNWKKCGGRVWSGYIHSKLSVVMSPCDHTNEPSGSLRELQLISVATSDAVGGSSNEARHVV
jgi:hypothetical protein